MRVRDAMSGQAARDESGLSLVEVLVASVILAIALAGTAATIINALNLTATNANRVLAANLAAAEIEQVRSLSFEALDDRQDDGDLVGPDYLGEHSWVRTVGGQDFEVTRTIRWATIESLDTVCSVDAGPADENVLAVEVEVAWSRMFGVRPVRSETTISPPIGAYERSAGILAVQVVDDSTTPQSPIQGASVTVRGPDPQTTIVLGTPPVANNLTDEDGCLVLPGMRSGVYAVEVSIEGYLDEDAARPTFLDATVEVRARTDVRVELRPSGYLGIELETRPGDLSPDLLLASGLPRFAVPTEGSRSRVGEFDGGDWVYSDTATRELPVRTYRATAGVCGQGGYLGESFALAQGLAGNPTVESVPLAGVDITWTEPPHDPLDPDAPPNFEGPMQLTATWQGECSDDPGTLDLGVIVPGEDLEVALPWTGEEASWLLQAVEVGGSQVADVVEVVGTPDDRLALEPGGLGDWQQAAAAEVVLRWPDGVCIVEEPTVVGSTTDQFPGLGVGPGTITVNLPPGTAVDDLLVFTAASRFSNAQDWAPQGDWQLLATSGARLATWARPVDGAASPVAFTRPTWNGWNETGTVHLTVLRGVDTDLQDVTSATQTPGTNGTSLTLPSMTVPAEQYAVIYDTVYVQRNQGQGLFSPAPDLYTSFGGSDAQSHVGYYPVAPEGTVDARTVTWNNSAARAGHRILLGTGVCTP